jgi:thiosulfate/3-mercaptopyruvate sulfurtransferase
MMFASLITLVLLAPSADPKEGRESSRADMLVEAGALMRTKQQEDTLLLDARTKQSYDEGHIPGACWLDAGTAAVSIEGASLARLGIGPKTRVIVYDDGIVRDAARLWWRLKYSGQENVALLDGGLVAWQSAGGTLTRELPQIKEIKARDASTTPRLATRDNVLEVLKSKSAQIVDARSEKEFCGETKQAKRGGAIPGAIHLEWTDLIDSKTKKFKSPEAMKRLFDEAGIDLNKPLVTYCQSGGRASVMAFGLELMGAANVRNYYKSWAEWGNDADTPIETPKPSRKE